ncbi:MAG TPA: hypothetical protein PLZ45_15575 [Ferruginibacter sp.]|nr:hypothetical protein [Ferruginibacter sp.]
MKKPLYLFRDTFFYRTRVYTIGERKELVLERLNGLYKKENGDFLDQSYGFVTHDGFKLAPPDSLGYSRWFESKPAYVHGDAFSERNNQTKLTVRIRPNSKCFVVFFLFSFPGLIWVAWFFYTFEKDLLATGLLLIATGLIISVIMVRVSCLRFLEKFEMYMGISPEKE